MMAEVCSAASVSLATPQATITALVRVDGLTRLGDGRVGTEGGHRLALQISTRSLALSAVPGVKVSTKPMIEDDGRAMLRASVYARFATPWKKPPGKFILQK